MTTNDLADLARRVVDANSYMTLGTADAGGHPWVTPVWFASEDYVRFHWVSSPKARHSRNLAERREVAIAIFDSTVPAGGAQAVYMAGTSEELTGAERERGIELFGRLSAVAVGRTWGSTTCVRRRRFASTARRSPSTSC